MVRQQIESDEVTVKATATKVPDGWVVEIDNCAVRQVRVASLANVDENVNRLTRQRRAGSAQIMRVHIYRYLSGE